MSTRNLQEAIRVRVTPEVRAQLEHVAERDERSVAAVIRRYVHEGLTREPHKKEA